MQGNIHVDIFEIMDMGTTEDDMGGIEVVHGLIIPSMVHVELIIQGIDGKTIIIQDRVGFRMTFLRKGHRSRVKDMDMLLVGITTGDMDMTIEKNIVFIQVFICSGRVIVMTMGHPQFMMVFPSQYMSLGVATACTNWDQQRFSILIPPIA